MGQVAELLAMDINYPAAAGMKDIVTAFTNAIKEELPNVMKTGKTLAVTKVVPSNIKVNGRNVKQMKHNGKACWGKPHIVL